MDIKTQADSKIGITEYGLEKAQPWKRKHENSVKACVRAHFWASPKENKMSQGRLSAGNAVPTALNQQRRCYLTTVAVVRKPR